MPEGAKESWLAKLFTPKVNFYLLLEEQAETTLSGMLALEQYMSDGLAEHGQKVRDLEKQADQQKLSLGTKLGESFVTPFDREDIYDVSLLLDEIINSAKATVREIEALEVTPSDPIYKEMAGTLVEGTRSVQAAIHHLKSNLAEAANHAQMARKAENRFNNTYRAAVKQLYHQDDLKFILKTAEVFRCLSHGATHIDRLGEKLLHVIVKMS